MNTNISGPLISLIVPVYNVKDYLKTCLQSILEQTYKNLEIILVDDGSDDGSSGICDEYARMDQRIKTIHLPQPLAVEGRNFTFMDAIHFIFVVWIVFLPLSLS